MAAFVKLLLNPTLLLRLRDLHYFLLFFLLFACGSLESHEDKSENYLLCKYCGADAADLDYAFTIRSPAAVKIENQTFSGKEVVVQTLKNPSNIYFEVITVRKSNCVGYGEWTKHDSWFPGYAWKLCICQPWGHFLGWVFEPFDLIKKNQKKASERGFYALNAENILTEQFSNSLICANLTEEEQKFLDSLEKEFKDRYTEKDEEFMAVMNEELPLPPLVKNWRDFSQPEERYGDRNNRYRDGDRYIHDRHHDRYQHYGDRVENSHSSRYVHRYRHQNNFQNKYTPF